MADSEMVEKKKKTVCTQTGPRQRKFVITYRAFAVLAKIIIEATNNLKVAGA